MFLKGFFPRAGSKEFQNSYSSACQFALVPQLDKEGGSTCPAQILLGRTSGRVDSLDSEGSLKVGIVWERLNPSPDMPVIGSSNSAVNKDIMSKI